MAEQKQRETKGAAMLRASRERAEVFYPLVHAMGLSASEVVALFADSEGVNE